MRLLSRLFPRYRKSSYAQSGEDLIIDFIFETIKTAQPTYLDIGAHHPVYLSNTFLFYSRGCHGVCVEPDPTLHALIRKKRKRDVCLNVGVGVGKKGVADFYVMTTKTLNTFSREEAERYQRYGDQRIERVIEIPLVPINEIIGSHFSSAPNLVSLDVEGLDLAILTSLDLQRWRPEVFCIETLTYTEDKTEEKITGIIDYMMENGYLLYGDTYINSIFVDRSAWLRR